MRLRYVTVESSRNSMLTHPWADHAKLIAVGDGNPGLHLVLGGEVDLDPAGKHLLAQLVILGLTTELKGRLDPHQVGQAAPFVVLQRLVDHLERHAQPGGDGVDGDPGLGCGGHGAVLVHQAVAHRVVKDQVEGGLGDRGSLLLDDRDDLGGEGGRGGGGHNKEEGEGEHGFRLLPTS